MRYGFIIRITASALFAPGVGSHPPAVGVGEVAPLDGLHVESCKEADAQLALLCQLLQGVHLPPSLALLEARSILENPKEA